jgi:hypothetical protein
MIPRLNGLQPLTRVVWPQTRPLLYARHAAWTEAKPDLAKKSTLENYVNFVQARAAEDKQFNPLDRMARQMGRVEEKRAASEFVQGARPQQAAQQPQDGAQEAARKPTLSIIAGIVGDYLKLCYDPAIDWVRWVAARARREHHTITGGEALRPGRGRQYVGRAKMC